MWRSVLDFIKRVFTLWNRMDKLEEELSKQREELELLNELVERLAFDQQRDRENTAHEHEKLMLRLENALLKFERRLPPDRPPKGR